VIAAPPEYRLAALSVRVTGVVQGVGFRPFVHRLAIGCGLTGWVRNGSSGVQIEIEGSEDGLARFLRDLRSEAPPLASIDEITATAVPVGGRDGFFIFESVEESGRQPVSPDVALCARCEAELYDPADRRYRYPFITCTDCGPRFTVIEAMPYDRARTSMRVFPQCPACLAEYRSPGNRRHHCETNSCPACGPRLWFTTGDAGRPHPEGAAALGAAAGLLLRGEILAIRGLGGFHLAVDATSVAAVDRLRARKGREAKPLAVMVRRVEAARDFATITAEEETLLRSPERPIVLVRLRSNAILAGGVAPGLAHVGVMLAYTPVQHLLLDLVGRPLVMTSGNRTEEPIAIDNAEALSRLQGIGDGYLLHDREIVARYDDSVVRVADRRPVLLRRARGYAPLPFPLPVPTPRPLVAVGPHLKNTFTLAHGDQAYVSQHIGDLESLETLEHFQATLDGYRRLFRIEPEVAVRDRHPGYLSTRIAEELGLERVIAVQHHHAHVAAVMAEHGVTEPVIGVAYDGTGYGDDGRIWGGEILLADLTGFRRVARLRYAPLPGGDTAVREPWRSALGYLSLEPFAAPAFARAFEGVPPGSRTVAERQLSVGLNSPLASSMGRLFDAAAAVIGVRQFARYEGQAAMELEALAGNRVAGELRCEISEEDGVWVLDPVPLLTLLGLRRLRGEDPADLAADFHASIAWATADLIRRVSRAEGITRVVLSGGVFQNARLLGSLCARLRSGEFEVLLPRRLGPNDGAVSYGQAAIAAAILHHERARV
jgi:hydrogenase maturation protein HypF